MSAIKFYTDAITGSLSSDAIHRTRPTAPVERQVPQTDQRKEVEDAATLQLSDAAKEYAAESVQKEQQQEKAKVVNETSNENAESPEVAVEEKPEQSPKPSAAADKTAERTAQDTEERQEQQELRELKSRDREVRAHEQAHISAGGRYIQGGASFTYETGPDGKQYAVGGEVSISVSSEGNPEETISKAQTIRRAALAPAKPSGADRRVASQASRMESEARSEQAAENREEMAAEQTKKAEGTKEKPEAEEVREEVPMPDSEPVIGPEAEPVEPAQAADVEPEEEAADAGAEIMGQVVGGGGASGIATLESGMNTNLMDRPKGSLIDLRA